MIADMMVEILAIVALGLALYAAVCDVGQMKIPNWVSIAIAGLFFIALVISTDRFFVPWWSHIAAAIGVMVVGFFMFAARLMGAGDTKLAASLILWIGAKGLVSFVFFMAMFGGLLGVVAIGLKARKPFKNPPEGSWVEKCQSGQSAVPYGVAITFGAIVSFWQSGLLKTLSTIF